MFEIFKKKEKTYEFILKAESGTILLNSVRFMNKKKAQEAVQHLNAINTHQISIERRTNHSGKFLFSLKERNGAIIANSHLYQSEAGMENGIKNLIKRIDCLSDLNQL